MLYNVFSILQRDCFLCARYGGIFKAFYSVTAFYVHVL